MRGLRIAPRRCDRGSRCPSQNRLTPRNSLRRSPRWRAGEARFRKPPRAPIRDFGSTCTKPSPRTFIQAEGEKAMRIRNLLFVIATAAVLGVVVGASAHAWPTDTNYLTFNGPVA